MNLTGKTKDGTAASVDYILTQPTTTANITSATLTVTGITASNKTYDGTTTTTLNTSGATLHGVISGDATPPGPGTVALVTSSATGAFASADVANAIIVQIAGLSLTGKTKDGTAASVDYTLTQPTTTANITQATLTVTGVTANNKTYDGTTTATLNTSAATLHGVVSGDATPPGPGTVALAAGGATGSFATPDVKNGITVQIAGLTLMGKTKDGTAASVDYTLIQPSSTTANITPATLTVTGITASNKTYNGNTSATINTSAATLHGAVSGDATPPGPGTVSLVASGATGNFATPDVKNGITVQIAGMTLTGKTKDGTTATVDYTLTQPTTTANITPATLTATGITAYNKTYHGGTWARLNTSAATLVGVINGDATPPGPGTVSLVTSGATGTFASPDVANNIVVQISGLTLTGKTKDGTAASLDYTLIQPTTTANITPRTLTVSGITASNKTYDVTTSATLNTSGATLNRVINGDATPPGPGTVSLVTSGATGTFASADVGNGITVQIAGLKLTGKTKDGTAATVDYTLVQPTTTANITPATLTVTGITAANKVYNANKTATLNTSAATLHGVISGDATPPGPGTVALVTSGATGTFASANVGNGITVQVAGLTLKGKTQDGTAASVDYTLTQPTTTANITVAHLDDHCR